MSRLDSRIPLGYNFLLSSKTRVRQRGASMRDPRVFLLSTFTGLLFAAVAVAAPVPKDTDEPVEGFKRVLPPPLGP